MNNISENNSNQPLVLQTINLDKTFDDAGTVVEVLRGVDFSVQRGDFVSILGASGSGKSTLLHMLGGLETPTSGKVKLNGQDYSTLNPDLRSLWRGKHLGFVYQLHHLLPEFSALENVCMPLLLQNLPARSVKEKAAYWLSEVGLSHRIHHRPSELSGGERQRVAIARAMVAEPACILADEPTGNLDEDTARKIQELMMRLNREKEISFVVATHDKEFASTVKCVYSMHLGRLELA